jgi:hypothetical protein
MLLDWKNVEQTGFKHRDNVTEKMKELNQARTINVSPTATRAPIVTARRFSPELCVVDGAVADKSPELVGVRVWTVATPEVVGDTDTLLLLGGALDGSARIVLVLELMRPGQSVLVDPTSV